MIQSFRMCAQAATAAAGRALRELAEFQVGQVRSTSRLSSARSCFTTPRLPLSSLIFLEAEPNDKACFINFKYLYIFCNLCYFNICYISFRVPACLTLTFFLDPQSGEGYGDGGGDFIFGFAAFFLGALFGFNNYAGRFFTTSFFPFVRTPKSPNVHRFACDVDIEFAIGYDTMYVERLWPRFLVSKRHTRFQSTQQWF